MTHKLHSGPPPHVGWWLCTSVWIGRWRWWNGNYWSMAASQDYAPEEAMHIAILDTQFRYAPIFEKQIKWSHYWPKNARVPRINPNTGEVTGGAA